MPRKKKTDQKIVDAPVQFEKNDEHGLTEMQASFVWHYTEGACGMTEAARKAGYQFPSASAGKLLNGKDYPNVVKAIRIKQDELAEKYAITPQKTGTMLWKVMESAYEKGQFNATRRASSMPQCQRLKSSISSLVYPSIDPRISTSTLTWRRCPESRSRKD